MLEVAVVAGMAAFALTSAVVDTGMFAWYRNIGTWAEHRSKFLYYLLTPARASHCATCFSFWAAMPTSIWACYLSSWGWLPLIWLFSAGLSMILYELQYAVSAARDNDPDELKRLVEDNLRKDEPEALSDFTAEAYNRTADEKS